MLRTVLTGLLSPTEALNIWKTRMCTDGDIVLFTSSHCLLHDQRITSMEAASYVCMIDEWDEFVVWSTLEIAIAFAELTNVCQIYAAGIDWGFRRTSTLM